MNNEVPWIASLCVKEHLIDADLAQQLMASMPPGADAMAFAQAVIDHAHITDIELMTRLATEAQHMAVSGAQAPALHTPSKNADEVDFSRVSSLTEPEAKAFMLDLLSAAQSFGASDLHLSAGSPPCIRNMRALEFLDTTPLSVADAHKLNTSLLDDAQKQLFTTHRDYDYALSMEGGRRIRVNLMEHKEGVKGTYRIVPEHILSPTELGFKNLPVIKKLLSYHNGLILVTGPVGAGKTTTLNSLINELNRTRDDHIITVEDPIEFLHTSLGCNVTQSQVGQHTETFGGALRSALREDPDVIVIGELRDLATIEMAISASETGHLVIGTMHTSDATTTLNRILDVFPASQQPQEQLPPPGNALRNPVATRPSRQRPRMQATIPSACIWPRWPRSRCSPGRRRSRSPRGSRSPASGSAAQFLGAPIRCRKRCKHSVACTKGSFPLIARSKCRLPSV